MRAKCKKWKLCGVMCDGDYVTMMKSEERERARVALSVCLLRYLLLQS